MRSYWIRENGPLNSVTVLIRMPCEGIEGGDYVIVEEFGIGMLQSQAKEHEGLLTTVRS